MKTPPIKQTNAHSSKASTSSASRRRQEASQAAASEQSAQATLRETHNLDQKTSRGDSKATEVHNQRTKLSSAKASQNVTPASTKAANTAKRATSKTQPSDFTSRASHQSRQIAQETGKNFEADEGKEVSGDKSHAADLGFTSGLTTRCTKEAKSASCLSPRGSVGNQSRQQTSSKEEKARISGERDELTSAVKISNDQLRVSGKHETKIAWKKSAQLSSSSLMMSEQLLASHENSAENQISSDQNVSNPSTSSQEQAQVKILPPMQPAHQTTSSDNSHSICPLNALYQEFATKRIIAQGGKDKPTIREFRTAFEKEMIHMEKVYQTQKAVRQEQLRVYEQNYGSRSAALQRAEEQFSHRQFNDQQVSDRVTQKECHRMLEYPSHPSAMVTHYQNGGASEDFGNDNNLRGRTESFSSQQASSVQQINAFQQNASGQLQQLMFHHDPLESFDSYNFQPNSLVSFYPKAVQRLVVKRNKQMQNMPEKVVYGLKSPASRVSKAKAKKMAAKMSEFSHCQLNSFQVIMQRLERRSKPIKKQEKIISNNLKKKRIYLERENFDILNVLYQVTNNNERASKPTTSHSKHSSRNDKKQKPRDTRDSKSIPEQRVQGTANGHQNPRFDQKMTACYDQLTHNAQVNILQTNSGFEEQVERVTVEEENVVGEHRFLRINSEQNILLNKKSTGSKGQQRVSFQQDTSFEGKSDESNANATILAPQPPKNKASASAPAGNAADGKVFALPKPEIQFKEALISSEIGDDFLLAKERKNFTDSQDCTDAHTKVGQKSPLISIKKKGIKNVVPTTPVLKDKSQYAVQELNELHKSFSEAQVNHRNQPNCGLDEEDFRFGISEVDQILNQHDYMPLPDNLALPHEQHEMELEYQSQQQQSKTATKKQQSMITTRKITKKGKKASMSAKRTLSKIEPDENQVATAQKILADGQGLMGVKNLNSKFMEQTTLSIPPAPASLSIKISLGAGQKNSSENTLAENHGLPKHSSEPKSIETNTADSDNKKCESSRDLKVITKPQLLQNASPSVSQPPVKQHQPFRLVDEDEFTSKRVAMVVPDIQMKDEQEHHDMNMISREQCGDLSPLSPTHRIFAHTGQTALPIGGEHPAVQHHGHGPQTSAHETHFMMENEEHHHNFQMQPQHRSTEFENLHNHLQLVNQAHSYQPHHGQAPSNQHHHHASSRVLYEEHGDYLQDHSSFYLSHSVSHHSNPAANRYEAAKRRDLMYQQQQQQQHRDAQQASQGASHSDDTPQDSHQRQHEGAGANKKQIKLTEDRVQQLLPKMDQVSNQHLQLHGQESSKHQIMMMISPQTHTSPEQPPNQQTPVQATAFNQTPLQVTAFFNGQNTNLLSDVPASVQAFNGGQGGHQPTLFSVGAHSVNQGDSSQQERAAHHHHHANMQEVQPWNHSNVQPEDMGAGVMAHVNMADVNAAEFASTLIADYHNHNHNLRTNNSSGPNAHHQHKSNDFL